MSKTTTKASAAPTTSELLTTINVALEALEHSHLGTVADMMSAIKVRKHSEAVQAMLASAQAGTERVPDYTAKG